MAQQTAVDWLIEQINNDAYQIAFGQTYVSIELIEQAKAMEKQQISEAYRKGVEEDVYNNPLKTGDEYYNETYTNDLERY